jgi:hypothetical protein
MNSRLSCNPGRRAQVTDNHGRLLAVWIVVCIFAWAPRAAVGGNAPAWMQALASLPVPAYDEKTDAVLLYFETNVTVLSPEYAALVLYVREHFKSCRWIKSGYTCAGRIRFCVQR